MLSCKFLTIYSVTYLFHRLHPLEKFLINMLKDEGAKGTTLIETVKHIDDDLPRL